MAEFCPTGNRPWRRAKYVSGIQLRVTNDGGDFQVDVLLLSEVRGPASAAQTLYRETAESREKCEKVAAERRAMRQFEVLPEGRVA